jgi:hypothetical protein
MQPNANTESNRAPEVTPTIKHIVAWRVTSVTVLPDLRLRVAFVDGTTGEVHMKSFLGNPSVDGTIFEQLRDPVMFARPKWCWGWFSGRVTPTWLRMQCMTLFANMVNGSFADLG